MTLTHETRVDIHAHYYPPRYLHLLREAGIDTVVGDDPLGGPEGMEERLSMLDAADISMQVLGVGPLFPTLGEPAAAVEAARAANDGLAVLCAEQGERFRMFACLPLPHIAESLAEIDRVAALPGLAGWSIGPTVLGRPMTDPEFFPVFEALEAVGATVFVHPVGTAMQFYPSHPDLTWLVGAVFEDTALAVDLALSGWLDRFPRLNVVIPHLGGALPFIVQRVDDQYLRRNPGAVSPRASLSSLWFDTVNSDSDALQLCLERLGSERVMLGTDFPFLPGPMFTRAVDYVDALPSPVRESVQSRSASRLLGLEGH